MLHFHLILFLFLFCTFIPMEDIKNCISSQIHDLQKYRTEQKKNNNNKTRKKIHKSKVIDKKNEKSMLFTKLCVVFPLYLYILHA